MFFIDVEREAVNQLPSSVLFSLLSIIQATSFASWAFIIFFFHCSCPSVSGVSWFAIALLGIFSTLKKTGKAPWCLPLWWCGNGTLCIALSKIKPTLLLVLQITHRSVIQVERNLLESSSGRSCLPCQNKVKVCKTRT